MSGLDDFWNRVGANAATLLGYLLAVVAGTVVVIAAIMAVVYMLQ